METERVRIGKRKRKKKEGKNKIECTTGELGRKEEKEGIDRARNNNI